MPLSKTLLIKNKLGLHARAATKLAFLASKFDAVITIQQDSKIAEADSVMALLMLESSQGKTIEVTTEGDDAQAALDAVEQLVNDRFDESE